MINNKYFTFYSIHQKPMKTVFIYESSKDFFHVKKVYFKASFNFILVLLPYLVVKYLPALHTQVR